MDSKRVVLLIPRSRVGDKIEKSFTRANFDVMRTEDPQQSLELLKTEDPDAVVVDWDFTVGGIQEITRAIRENVMKTCLVLISKSRSVEERIHALEEGADDCFVQVPQVDELVAKVTALVRRIDWMDHTPRRLKVKDLEINLNTHEVRKNSNHIDLTYTQFKLLFLLASHREYVFTREEILNFVWGQNTYVTDRTVDVHVKRLREKLGEDKQPLKYILTIHGLGYRFA